MENWKFGASKLSHEYTHIPNVVAWGEITIFFLRKNKRKKEI